jgi:D-alanyl-D-alanine carboxypeptidase
MNPRLAALAALGREVAMPASVLAWIIAFGPAVIDRTGATSILDRPTTSLDADAKFSADSKLDAGAKSGADAKLNAETKSADKLPIDEPIASLSIALAAADAVVATGSVRVASAAEPMPASKEPEAIVTAALTDPSETLPPETAPEATAKTSMATPEPGDANPAAGSAADPGNCAVADSCIDHYLWALYQRTPKEDSVKEQQQRQVSVKRKGKQVTVTRTVTTLVDEDFSWKDPKAADHVGMPVTDYVIGGMDREFKARLFQLLRAADAAGLSPGITSAFRDDYRQSIASGLKAANDRSYHGGSSRGGYGHGIAADIVSVNGVTRAQRLNASQTLWSWVDAHGKDFGIGRPYLDRDPPHVAPIDGQEYAKHHPGMRTRQATASAKPGKGSAARDDHAAAKRARTARSSRVRTI